MKHMNFGALRTDAASGLHYRTAQPEPHTAQRCLVLLHGVGSHELSVAELAEGVEENTLIVLVRAPLALGPQQFAWFQVAFTAHGPRIEPTQAEKSRTSLIQLIASLQQTHAIAPGKTVIAGFSQGGIMSASVALTSPESVGGFGLLSGRILSEIEPLVASPQRLAHLQAFVAHGEQDSKLPVSWAHRSHEWLQQLQVQHDLHLYPIDHCITPQVHADFLAWQRPKD